MLPNAKHPPRWWPLVLTALALLGCNAGLWLGWAAVTLGRRAPQPAAPTATPWPTPPWSLPTAAPPTAAPAPAGSPAPPTDPAHQTYQALLQARPPLHDPVTVFTRLTGQPVTWHTPTPAAPLPVGTVRTFYVTDTDGVQAFPIQAQLAAVTEHAYVWVDQRVRYDPATAQALAREFEAHIYPTTRAFFGAEPSPGIDGDPHLYILFAQGVGSVAGYFSAADALPPQVHPFSNAHEMFILSASMLDANTDTYAVLAHEFQHMIHQARDPNEEAWLNEGFSELAVLLNGYDRGFFDLLYLRNPDFPLLHWPDPAQGSSLPYYGGGFLFTLYFLERFGEQATRALVAAPANGVDAVEAVLQRIGARHPVTGQPLRAEDLFLDWAIANFLADPDLEDGRFGYTRHRIRPAEPSLRLDRCPQGPVSGEVAPFGVDYITIACRGVWQLEVTLDPWARLWPVEPHSGDFAVWSTYGDSSDMRLTRTFDFTAYPPGSPLTLTYWTWYDIEADYDYGYVLASTDGQTWHMLRPPGGTDRNPVGNNYGWGYTDASGGWVQEQVDLSAYAGQRVQVRFEYLTDAAVNRWGWLLDDLAVPEAGYAEDFETGLGDWQAEGWARATNRIPRAYRAALILQGRGQTQVRYLPITEGLRLQAELPLDGEWRSATLVLMDVTRFTRFPARYRLEVRAP